MTKTKTNSGRFYARLIRLGRQDDAAIVLRHVISRKAAANDNFPPTDGMNVDSVMVMRPTEEEIRRASIRVKDGKPDPSGEVGLRFNGKGHLVAYRAAAEDGTPALGKDGEEMWLKPVERYRQPKGSRRRTRVQAAADNNAHGSWLMSLRGLEKIPDRWVQGTRYPSFGAVFEMLRTTYDAMLARGIESKARDELATHGVDGMWTLDECGDANPQASIARCKPGMAWKVDFLSGKPDASGTATEGSFVGAPDASEMTMIAAIDASAVKMGKALEMAVAGMTFKEIAAAHGHNDNKGGEEWAARAVDREIEDLKKSAA